MSSHQISPSSLIEFEIVLSIVLIDLPSADVSLAGYASLHRRDMRSVEVEIDSKELIFSSLVSHHPLAEKSELLDGRRLYAMLDLKNPETPSQIH